VIINRRNFLRACGVGAGALSLPLLGAQQTSHAGGTFPKRFVVVFTANGTIPSAWSPTGGESDFTFGRILEPLTPFKDKVIVVDGIDMVSARNGPGDGHQQGMGHMLTANELLPGDTMGGCESCAPVSWAASISIDQLIANQIGEGTSFRSLELGVGSPDHGDIWTRMCYRDAGDPLPPEKNPYRVFDRVFAGLDPSSVGDQRRDFMRRQVIDHVYADYRTVRDRLGTDDRSRIERHIEGLDAIAARLDMPSGLGAACRPPALTAGLDPNSTDDFPAIGELQMQNLAMAFACDLTRVATIQWGASVSQQAFPWLGFGDRHHDLSHEGDSNADAVEKLIQINRWYAEQFAYLCAQLDAIPEGDGTLLDNTCIVWTNELGKGNSHTRDNMPCVIAGGAGGSLRTGRWLQYRERSHADLWTTLAQVYGVEISTFGNPRYNTSTMSELL
jgi:hypothetical protein